MVINRTKNSALPTLQAFHYQMLVALKMCFDLKTAQVLRIEFDGDVSLVGQSSSQIEVKHYVDPLTDQHVNLWKSLANWINPAFNHSRYSKLILLTTQKFGTLAQISQWNQVGAKERLAILKNVSNKTNKRSKIKKYQQLIFSFSDKDLMNCLSKIQIVPESENLPDLSEKLLEKLRGIPLCNRKEALKLLVGHLYDLLKNRYCDISCELFDQWIEQINATLGHREMKFPTFSTQPASNDSIKEFGTELFVRKIQDIKLDSEVPNAVGCWLELVNSLKSEVHQNPVYKERTEKYRDELVQK